MSKQLLDQIKHLNSLVDALKYNVQGKGRLIDKVIDENVALKQAYADLYKDYMELNESLIRQA